MNKRTRLTISIIVAVFLLACACPASSLPLINNQPATNEPALPNTQPEIPTVAPQQETNAIYSDDFSAESSEIETYSDDTGSGETKDGVYILRSTSELWFWGRSKSEFKDTVIEFDANLESGPANNNIGIGVICRLHTRDDGSIDGYLLAISADGFYSIRNISAGSMTPLVDWTSSDSVNQGNENNKIRATCNGSDLSLEVNGDSVATATATADGSASGSIAFATVSFEKDQLSVETHFDNLVISKP